MCMQVRDMTRTLPTSAPVPSPPSAVWARAACPLRGESPLPSRVILCIHILCLPPPPSPSCPTRPDLAVCCSHVALHRCLSLRLLSPGRKRCAPCLQSHCRSPAIYWPAPTITYHTLVLLRLPTLLPLPSRFSPTYISPPVPSKSPSTVIQPSFSHG